MPSDFAADYQQYPHQHPHQYPQQYSQHYHNQHQYPPQIPQKIPQQITQDSRYSQNQAHPQDPRYQQEYARPGPSSYSPPRNGYRQFYSGYAKGTGQIPGAAIYQETYQAQYPHELPIRGHAYQPQYAPSPRLGMEPVTSTVEKPYAGSQKVQPVVLQDPVQAYSPPPAYSSRQPSPRSSNSSSPAHYSEPTLRPADSTGHLADGYKLVAIPATSAKLGSPFLRAYPPALESYGISREPFIQFIDRLNRATVASPPIQVLGLAGNIVSFVPLHTAQVVGNAVDLAAKVSTVAVSKGRTEMLLKEANTTLFAAAGLKVQVAKLDVVAKLGHIPILDAEGKVDKKPSILLPFEEDQELQMHAQERRVHALSTWLSPLNVESLPELDESNNMFGQMHAKVSERQRHKEEEKILKDRKKMHKDYAKDKTKEDGEYEAKMQEYAAKESKIQEKGGRRMDKDLRELEKKREKLTKEHNKEIRKIEKDRRKDDKEEDSMRKILFLVVQKV